MLTNTCLVGILLLSSRGTGKCRCPILGGRHSFNLANEALAGCCAKLRQTQPVKSVPSSGVQRLHAALGLAGSRDISRAGPARERYSEAVVTYFALSTGIPRCQ